MGRMSYCRRKSHSVTDIRSAFDSTHRQVSEPQYRPLKVSLDLGGVDETWTLLVPLLAESRVRIARYRRSGFLEVIPFKMVCLPRSLMMLFGCRVSKVAL